MTLDPKVENGLDGDGEESHLAQILLAGRMGRRRKIAGLALARKIMESEDEGEDVDDDDDEDEGGEEHKLARLILAGGLARRRRRRRLGVAALLRRA